MVVTAMPTMDMKYVVVRGIAVFHGTQRYIDNLVVWKKGNIWLNRDDKNEFGFARLNDRQLRKWESGDGDFVNSIVNEFDRF